MNKETSPYSDTIKADFVDMPEKMINYFKKQQIRFSHKEKQTYIYAHLRNRGNKIPSLNALTYSNIKGRNAPEITLEDLAKPELKNIEEYTFIDGTKEGEKRSKHIARKAIQRLFGTKINYNIKSKAYMIRSGTQPIKITYSSYKKKRRNKKHIFVKRPSTSRILGKWLYNIMSGMPKRAYTFNKAVFIEEPIPGDLLYDVRDEEEKYFRMPSYNEGLVRACVHSKFMLLDDVKNFRNRILAGSKKRTVLFDFNIMFKIKDGKPHYVDPLKYYKNLHRKGGYARLGNKFWRYDKKINEIVEDEMNRIRRRIEDNEEEFFDVVKIMEDVVDYDGLSYREKAKMFGEYASKDSPIKGAKSLEDLFLKKLNFD